MEPSIYFKPMRISFNEKEKMKMKIRFVQLFPLTQPGLSKQRQEDNMCMVSHFIHVSINTDFLLSSIRATAFFVLLHFDMCVLWVKNFHKVI